MLYRPSVVERKKYLFPIICILFRKCPLLIDSPFHIETEINWKLKLSQEGHYFKWHEKLPQFLLNPSASYMLRHPSPKAEAKEIVIYNHDSSTQPR